MQSPRSSRRYDLDWLRTLAVWLLVPFHAANVYAPHLWYLEAASTSRALHYGIILSLDPWHMPLLFLLSGAATGLTLSGKSNRAYRTARWQRLGIPFLFSWLVIVPVGQYFAALHHGVFTGSFLGFLPGYFASIPHTDLAGFTGDFAIAHLWFLAALLAYSLLALPLFRHWQTPAGRQSLARLATMFEQPGFILAMPLVTVGLLLPPLWLGGRALVYYAFTYVVGFVWVAEPRFHPILYRHRQVALGLAGICLGVPIGLFSLGWASPNALWANFLLYVCGSWYILLACWGYAQQYLTRPSPILTYWNEAGLPFYVLHQPVMIGLGYVLLPLQLSSFLGFALLCLSTFALSLLIYQGIIRPLNPMRMLFGLKHLSPQD